MNKKMIQDLLDAGIDLETIKAMQKLDTKKLRADERMPVTQKDLKVSRED